MPSAVVYMVEDDTERRLSSAVRGGKGGRDMKKLFKACSLILCAAFGAAVGLSGCVGNGESTLLAAPAEAESFSWPNSDSDEFRGIVDSANSFAARFTQSVYGDYEEDNNLALSPVSVYMSLALAAQCAEGDTREQILTALGQSQGDLAAGFAYLYSSLNSSYLTGGVAVGNSIWLQEGVEFNADCIDSLAADYYCYSYAADFRGDNKDANLAVRRFVREQTKGLIDVDFQLDDETCFVLVSALYLKDNWNFYGDDIALTEDNYNFTQSDGEVISTKLMRGYYSVGRVQSGQGFTTFYADTYHGYSLHFILPDEGYTVRDVMTADAINYVLDIPDYGYEDNINKIHYYTRCLFPQFSASYDGDVKGTLAEEFGITNLFDELGCNLSSLLPDGKNDLGENVFCTQVRHLTTLTVDRKGIEGAAVVILPGAGAAGPDEYEEVYLDFVIDRSFGYVLTDRYGTVLFTGVVNNI